jgi:hypothetical protein
MIGEGSNRPEAPSGARYGAAQITYTVPEAGRLKPIVHPVGVPPLVLGTGALVMTRAATLTYS